MNYLIIGHVEFDEQEWFHMTFSECQPYEYLRKEFIKKVRKDDPDIGDREIYIDFIINSKEPMAIKDHDHD